MGKRKRLMAERLKERRKNTAYAVLRNSPISPRKMRLVADLVRGKEINEALAILRYTPKDAARRLEKLLYSALHNWQAKNEDKSADESEIYIKEIFVDSAGMLKRIRPRAHGRAFRIRKRFNHVTVILDTK